MRIEANVYVAILDEWRPERPQDCTTRIGDRKARDSRQRRKDQALGKQLTYHAASTGSESGSQGNLLFSPGSQGKLQVRHVYAGDHEDQTHNSHHQATSENDLVAIVHAHGGV